MRTSPGSYLRLWLKIWQHQDLSDGKQQRYRWPHGLHKLPQSQGVVPFWKKNTAEGMCCCWCSLDQSKAPLWMLAGATAPFSAVQGSTYCMQIQRATWSSNLFSTYMLHMYIYAYCICIYRSTYIIVINTQTFHKKLQLCKRSEIPSVKFHTQIISPLRPL